MSRFHFIVRLVLAVWLATAGPFTGKTSFVGHQSAQAQGIPGLAGFMPSSAVALSPVKIYLTVGTQWIPPSNWNNSANTIEAIAGGGGGGVNGGSESSARTNGAAGGAGIEYTSTGNNGGPAGAGGGAGSGGAAISSSFGLGASGGLYGGGGSGGGSSGIGQAAGGAGAQGIIVITYTPTVLRAVYYLTAGSTFSVPSNWNNATNSIEAIGGGGGGGGATSATTAGSGGGGAGYSKATSQTLSPGAPVT